MAENAIDEKINFYKPLKRFLLPINNFHIPKKLFNQFKKGEYKFVINSRFSDVIDNCSKPRKGDQDTWINQIIKNTYMALHNESYAKSIECFYNKKLVGGLYGIHIGACFFGESMFSKSTNSSKLSLLYLISILKKYNFILLDSQFYNPHLLQFGGYEIIDTDYQNILKEGIKKKCKFPDLFDFQNSIETLQSLSHKS